MILALVQATHPPLVGSVKRSDRHLCAVIDMIEAGKPCQMIAQRLQAVEKTVVNDMRAPIHDHRVDCLDVDHSLADHDELKSISCYL